MRPVSRLLRTRLLAGRGEPRYPGPQGQEFATGVTKVGACFPLCPRVSGSSCPRLWHGARRVRSPGARKDRGLFDMRFALTAAALLAATGAAAAVQPFPPAFRTQMVDANGTKIYVRSGGKGPAVVMLHGFGDTGYTKKNESLDVAAVLDHLKVNKADLVTHDIGNMVGYAFAAQYPDRVTRWVVIDAPLPGIGNWDSITRSPLLWHFNFRGPDVERLVAGRERIYLDRFWNELSANPKAIDEATRQHYAALYARPRAMHDAFEQFGAFAQDAIDNKALLAAGKLTMPVLAVGAEKSFGPAQADNIRVVATDVAVGIVPASGHWVMEENPDATTRLVLEFLAK